MARGRPSKKAHIVKSARGLFTQQGYQSTSIDQVVATAGVSKPTVYSNFPTKLVLWEAVFAELIEESQYEMQAVLDRLNTHAKQDFFTGWVKLWETWLGLPERVRVYRILLGEQHKMMASTLLMFDEFEGVLDSALLAWLGHFSMSPNTLFILKAVTKEAILTPVLMNRASMSATELKRQLDPLLVL